MRDFVKTHIQTDDIYFSLYLILLVSLMHPIKSTFDLSTFTKGEKENVCKNKAIDKKIDICVINHLLLLEHDDFYRKRIRNGVEQLVAVKAPLLSHQLGRTISFSGNHATANGFPGGPAECCL